MFDEAPPPKAGRGQALLEALREDLDLFSVGDLHERIALLEEEIARARAKIAAKGSGLAAAEALFSRKPD